MKTNLPPPVITDSAEATKIFFNSYGLPELEFNASEVDIAVGFFKSRGFEDDAALVTAAVILKQAKVDGISVKELLDTLRTFTGIEISGLIAEILNNNRSSISALGFRKSIGKIDLISRNISA